VKLECLKEAWKVASLLWWLNPSKPFKTKNGSVYIRVKKYYIRFSDHQPLRNSRTKWVVYCNERKRKKRFEYGYCEESKMIKDVENFFKRKGYEKPKDNSAQ